MMKTKAALLALLAIAGTAFADPHETQTLAGPYGTFADDTQTDTNPLNSSATATFTGLDGGVSYSPISMRLVMDFTSVTPTTWAYDIGITVTPPDGGAPFYLYPSDEEEYTTLDNVTIEFTIPAGVNPIGTWSFLFWDGFQDGDGVTAESDVSNVRVSLVDRTIHDLGTLGSTDVVATTDNYAGPDVKWYKVTLPSDADDAGGFYMDLNTKGTSTSDGGFGANDTEIGVFDSAGMLVDYNDDISVTERESYLTFGSTAARDHGASGAVYDGSNGALAAGDYYIAAGTYDVEFDDNFSAVSTSGATGTLVVNIFSNFPGAPATCSVADIGVAGGGPGQDGHLDNNDFISFITLFFAQDAVADMGSAGGLAGSDGNWNNNDFIAFINHFFADTAACNG